MKLIRYEYKREGIWVYLPLYAKEFSLLVRGNANDSSSKRKSLEVFLDREEPLDIDLVDSRNLSIFEDPFANIFFRFNKGYCLQPTRSGEFTARFHFKHSDSYSEEDLKTDNHVGRILRDKAGELKNGDNYQSAKTIYEYVQGIPLIESTDKRVFLINPRTPTQVIRTNRARKCVCKAELFKDMCVASGIPARCLGAEFYSNEDISLYVNRRIKSRKNHSHAFAAFFYNGWQLVDPTLGGFDLDFKTKNYYSRVLIARGIQNLKVDVKST